MAPIRTRALLALAAAALVAGPCVVAPGPCGPSVEAAPLEGAAPPAFPQAWLGQWRGEARTLTPGGASAPFRMELVVAPTAHPGRYLWKIVFDGPAGRQERPYQLRPKDADKGQFVIDEGQGVEIPLQAFDGGIYAQFAVGGSRITMRERLEGAGSADERITVELLVTREEPGLVTGGAAGGPEVLTWPIVSLQTAVLSRAPPSDG